MSQCAFVCVNCSTLYVCTSFKLDEEVMASSSLIQKCTSLSQVHDKKDLFNYMTCRRCLGFCWCSKASQRATKYRVLIAFSIQYLRQKFGQRYMITCQNQQDTKINEPLRCDVRLKISAKRKF